MCKVAVIPYIKAGKEEVAMTLARELAPLMTRNDADGFGYMALGNHGIFGERWLETKDAFKAPPIAPIAARSIEASYLGALKQKGVTTHNAFGAKSKRITCLALHARMATCGVSMENVHPFVTKDGNTALIHNGVISNHARFEKTLSTCDSEAILTSYLDENVVNVPDNVQRVAESLQGWYVAVALAKAKDGTYYLDIIKDDATQLHAAYIAELDGIVLCTKEEMILQACAKLKFKVPVTYEVESSVLIRHNAMTGEVLRVTELDIPEPVSISPIPTRYNAAELQALAGLSNDDGPDLDSESEEDLDAFDFVNYEGYRTTKKYHR